MKSGARLEVGAVGQFQLGEGATKRHEGQVEVVDGGHPEQRERERESKGQGESVKRLHDALQRK